MIRPNPRVTHIVSDGVRSENERKRVGRAQSKGNESFMEMSGVAEDNVGDRSERERSGDGHNFCRAATRRKRLTCRRRKA